MRTPWNTVSIRKDERGGYSFAVYNDHDLYIGKGILARGIKTYRLIRDASRAADDFATEHGCVHYGI